MFFFNGKQGPQLVIFFLLIMILSPCFAPIPHNNPHVRRHLGLNANGSVAPGNQLMLKTGSNCVMEHLDVVNWIFMSSLLTFRRPVKIINISLGIKLSVTLFHSNILVNNTELFSPSVEQLSFLRVDVVSVAHVFWRKSAFPSQGRKIPPLSVQLERK